MQELDIVTVTVLDWHKDGTRAIWDANFEGLFTFYLHPRNVMSRNCFIWADQQRGSISDKLMKPHTRCNVMVRRNGKLISYKDLKERNPQVYELIKSLPPI